MAKLISTNPSKNFEVLGEVDVSTESEIIQKVADSKEEQKRWAKLTLDERISYLNNVYDVFTSKIEGLAQLVSKEMWMPIKLSRFEIESGLNYFKWNLDNAKKYLSPKVTFENETEIHKIHFEAKWVIWIMIPWNFPFSIFIRQTIQSLLVWNTIIMKHSKETCLFWKALEKVFIEAWFPENVFIEVYWGSEIADILVEQDLDMICFTWSTRVGKMLYKKAAEKFIPIIMELWWSAPWIVFGDVVVDDVVETIFQKRFWYSWQVCDGLKRLIVHESLYDEMVKKLRNYVWARKIGDAINDDTDIWPMVWMKQIVSLERQLEDAIEKWAKIVTWWKRYEWLDWAYFEPTILTDISFDMQVWNTEVFWPILPIVPFKTYEEAIALANDTEYWLGWYVYTNDKDLYDKVSMDLNTGMILQNTTGYEAPTNPFWWVKNSWLWRENWEFWFYDVSDIKIVAGQK